MGRIVRFVLFACVLTLVALLLLAWGGYRAAQYEPEFYRVALQAESAQQAELGDQFEHTVLELHNDARRDGQWEAVFTDEQLNGWLAVEMPHKFPELLPEGAREPRVAIRQNEAHVACRVNNEQFAAVISFVVQASLTDEPNTIALRISKLRAGAMPIPLKQFLDPITTAAQNSQVPLRWSQSDGDPVALITIPSQHEDFKEGEIRITSFEFRDHGLRVAGETTKPAS